MSLQSVSSPKSRVLTVFLLLLTAGCGGGGSSLRPVNYEASLSQAWGIFRNGDYEGAAQAFEATIALDPSLAAGYAGLGWAQGRTDDLSAAYATFTAGSNKVGSDEIQADLQAGWAFVCNALASDSDTGPISESNVHVTAALDLAPAWELAYVPGIDRRDLIVLKAENHFLLGEMSASLSAVRALDSGFSADVNTAAGQAELATRIESLVEEEMNRTMRAPLGTTRP